MEFIIENRPKSPLAFEQISMSLQKIRQYVRNEVRNDRKFTLRDVAAELNISEYNINKTLIKATGETLKSFVGKCRIEALERQGVRRY